jgi:hypothetical protein
MITPAPWHSLRSYTNDTCASTGWGSREKQPAGGGEGREIWGLGAFWEVKFRLETQGRVDTPDEVLSHVKAEFLLLSLFLQWTGRAPPPSWRVGRLLYLL